MVERRERLNYPQHKILFLVANPTLLKKQLKNQPVALCDYSLLARDVSTDTLFETRHALSTAPNLGQFALTGFPGIEKETLQRERFDILVAGENFGCGSGREQAVLALKDVGIQFIFATSFAPIFAQNCLNNGLYPLTNFEILKRMQQGEAALSDEILNEFDQTQREILTNRGLIGYSLACLRGEISPPEIKTGPRPMTMAEKIIAGRLQQAEQERREVFVKPSDHALFPLTPQDACFTYELHTSLIHNLLEKLQEEFGISTSDLRKLLVFEDHVVWWGHHQTAELLQAQADFAAQHGSFYYQRSNHPEDYLASQGICHLLMAEDHALPGQIIIGPDSHTCTAGALGSLSFCVEPTGIANAMLTGQVLLKVPESVKVNLDGQLPSGCTTKDVMLYLLSQCRQHPQIVLGKVLEYSGRGLENLPPDELLVLTNMATEAGAFTGIIEPTKLVIEYLRRKRNLTEQEVKQMIIKSNPDAQYSQSIKINLSQIEPMVALPGHPQNAVPLSQAEGIKIDKAFIGSCTGGKLHDLRLTAHVLENRKVNPRVQLVVQAASMEIHQQAIKEGLARIFQEAGAWFLPPACGACIGLGPGRGTEENQVILSASNRNYPGRMGEGEVYLANPLIVAASALAGHITLP